MPYTYVKSKLMSNSMAFNKRRHTMNYIKNPQNPLRQPVRPVIDSNKEGLPILVNLTKPILAQSKRGLLEKNSSKFFSQGSKA